MSSEDPTGRAKRDDVPLATYQTVARNTAVQFTDFDASIEVADKSPSSEQDTKMGAVPSSVAGRYTRRELLGKGGMGEVWRVHDERLNRPVALKVLHGAQSAETAERFEEEARVTAGLQHPGILPVHDLGQLADGRIWFTMKEVRGRTLSELIEDVHKEWRLGRIGRCGWTFRRLMEGYLRVVEAVAYAHARGVVHRDIKPANIMFGDYGEVQVLDWGIAKVLGSLGDAPEGPMESLRESLNTSSGVISGTPAYMSPEQAQGRSSEVTPASDVFSLGATLYDLLCDRPPRLAKKVHQLLFQVGTGMPPIPPPSSHRTGAPTDEQLDAIVLKALHIDEDERYPSAAELAEELAAWLDGAKKRERALQLVAEAQNHLLREASLVADGERYEQEATAALQGVADNAPVEDKLQGWRLEDAAKAAQLEAQDLRTEAVGTLRAALSHAPDLAEAHIALSEVFAATHARLEEQGKTAEARAVAADLAQHDVGGTFSAYLAGTGLLTLHTDVPAMVRVHRYLEQDRRLEPVFLREVGPTPLTEVPLEMGSYLLTLHAEGREVVRYPVWIRRQEHWTGVAPGGSTPSIVRLPLKGSLGSMIYVPPGWFWSGDDVHTNTLPLTRTWTDGFLIGRNPVTVGEYVEFLNDLPEEEVEEAVPRVPGVDKTPYLVRNLAGQWIGIDPTLEGIEHIEKRLDLPITMVTSAQAAAFAAWKGARLPTELEWQHAARGADRRWYPWGDTLDPTWCQMIRSTSIPTVVPVESRPLDISPYGARGMAGNVSDWVQPPNEHMALMVGGSAGHGPTPCKVTQRASYRMAVAKMTIGFRIVRPTILPNLVRGR